MAQNNQVEDQQPPQQTTEEKEKTIDFNFPLLTLRTKRFTFIFDKLGKTRGSKYIAWVFLALVPIIAGLALFLITGSLITLLSNPAVSQSVSQTVKDLGVGSILMLPGVNPMLPIVYGWIAIVIAIVIHEGAHGIIARNNGFRVKSSGLLFFLIIPIGAFVDVDEEQLKKARARPSVKVMAAGVGGNIILGAVCLICLIAVVGSLTPIVNGVYISEVTQDMPAQAAGLQPKDVLVSVDNVTITSSDDLRSYLENKTAGEMVLVTVRRGDNWDTHYTTTLNLTKTENRTVMGVMIYNLQTEAVLNNYNSFSIERLSIYLVPPTLASTYIPYSDTLSQFYTSPLGPSWSVIANLFYWIWFVNFNLAIFNALPIYPLDGGRIFNIALKRYLGKRLSEKTIYRVTVVAAVACLAVVLAGAFLPFLL
ncbi:PDZ domain-containing protein [Candidatus Bathyarchaeota archaeon]|nr:PDZ domain-containing protein [Candidatus Bathyarchaeota archaeon]